MAERKREINFHVINKKVAAAKKHHVNNFKSNYRRNYYEADLAGVENFIR